MPPPASALQPHNNRFSVIVNHKAFINTIIFLILLNSVLIGLETFPALYDSYSSWFAILDQVLLWLFTVEIALRLMAVRPTWVFFKNGWNVFDFIIVASGHLLAGAPFVTVLRILRVLRMLRAFSVFPSLRRMVHALILTIPSLGNIMLLMGLVLYIFGVAGTVLFAEVDPVHFGSLPASLLTLFQVATLEAWASEVMRPLLEVLPWAWIYFVIFILIGTFVVINLFLGVIVNSMEKVDRMDEKAVQSLEAEMDMNGAEIRGEITALRQEIAELKQILLGKPPM